MRARVLALALFTALLVTLLYFADPSNSREPRTVLSAELVDGRGVHWWARRARANKRDFLWQRKRTLSLIRAYRPAAEASATEAIRYVFGPYAAQALRVSYCETGGTYSVYASNGQYLGLFQMGDYARGRYGHGFNAWAQAVSAYRYFADSGFDWSPWACKP